MAEFLDVDAPFHSHLLEPAVTLVDEWAARCGISMEGADTLTRAVTTDPLDWAGVAETVKDFGRGYVVDLGPGNLQRPDNRESCGHGYHLCGCRNRRRTGEVVSGGPLMVTAGDWSGYAPQLATIGGHKVLRRPSRV